MAGLLVEDESPDVSEATEIQSLTSLFGQTSSLVLSCSAINPTGAERAYFDSHKAALESARAGASRLCSMRSPTMLLVHL